VPALLGEDQTLLVCFEKLSDAPQHSTYITVMCSPKARNMSRRRSGINSLFDARHLRFPLQQHEVTYLTRASGRVSLLPCIHGPVSYDLPGSPNLHKTVP
jgi:hypothetical protein